MFFLVNWVIDIVHTFNLHILRKMVCLILGHPRKMNEWINDFYILIPEDGLRLYWIHYRYAIINAKKTLNISFSYDYNIFNVSKDYYYLSCLFKRCTYVNENSRWFRIPYSRHYNPRFVYFLPTFWTSFM